MRVAVGAREYAAVGSYQVGLPLAASLEVKTRTRVLYADRSSLRVAYQLRDALGESRVSLDRLAVTLVLRFEDGDDELTIGCHLPAQASAIGECGSTIALTWFGASARSASVRVLAQYLSSTAMVSSGSNVILQPVVAPSSLATAGMVASLPESPRYVDDEFEVVGITHSVFGLNGFFVLSPHEAGVSDFSG